MFKYYLLSLGCPKNEVDAESMATSLQEAGYLGVAEPQDADVLIVNTCAFIEEAVSEAINAILKLADYKVKSSAKYLLVTGCLPQRYKKEIVENLPEVDAVLGTAQYGDIVPTVNSLLNGEDLHNKIPGSAGSINHLRTDRIPVSSQETYAYLKIAEGCDNACTYCKIPALRGKLQSRNPQSIIREAKHLVSLGKTELILIAQDTTRYAWDLNSDFNLCKLIKQLTDEVEEVEQIRILYAYADAISDELIAEMANNDKVCNYLDLPIQHASNKILQAMGRHESQEIIADRIKKLRQAIPEIIIRSTVMVGFPGETDEDFQQLLDFIKTIQFDRLGCFIFSAEEGTRAASLDNQVPYEIAAKRYKKLMQLQEDISLAKNKERIGEIVKLRFDDIDDDGILFKARSFGEAPDIDPIIHVASTDPNASIGSYIDAKIVDAEAYDLWGVTVNECSE